MAIGDTILIVCVVIFVPLLLIGLPIYLLIGGLYSFARKPLENCFAGIDCHEDPKPGDVTFVYHTYRGFLVWWTQAEHHVAAPPDEARRLLRRLLKFNLTWGLLTGIALVIPFLAIGNYYAQIRSLARQQRDLAMSGGEITSNPGN